MSAYRSSGYYDHVCNGCKVYFISEDYVDDYCSDCEKK